MPRNAEVIRLWTMLRELEASRRLTIDGLAEKSGVSTRTIRRVRRTGKKSSHCSRASGTVARSPTR